ncbi:Molybdopterin synthase catalytic subunit [bacterium HR19]|nr:Molybdopterin synthase catalytic subunit [bacterium HR19]
MEMKSLFFLHSREDKTKVFDGKEKKKKGRAEDMRKRKYIVKGKISFRFSRGDEKCGSFVVFLGVVRADKTPVGKVKYIEYSAYEEMAEKEIEKIIKEAKEKFRVEEIDVKHRVGKVRVGEPSFLVVVSSEHRKEGFAAAKYITDEVKKRVPIWKKEVTDKGKIWK